MRKLIIDRNMWLRGEGGTKSFLLRPNDQKQCCVGIYLEHCGIPRNLLEGIKAANGIAVQSVLPNEARWLPEDDLGLYVVNDSKSLTEEARESAIVARFAQHKVQVEFIN